MKRIDRYETISTLITKQIKRGVKTNNFLSEDELKTEIDAGTLCYSEYDGGLLILRERETHYILNYYINDITKTIEEKFDKDIVVEIVSRPNDDNKEIIDYFKNHNMVSCLERIRMVNKDCEKVDNTQSNLVQLCKTSDLKEVLHVLQENFDVYTGCLPTDTILLKDIENENVYVYKNESIEGVLQISKSRVASEIKHLVVVEGSRRKGIAKTLVNKYFEDIDVKRKTVWTGKENETAKVFYQRMGYEADGYKSIVLKTKG